MANITLFFIDCGGTYFDESGSFEILGSYTVPVCIFQIVAPPHEILHVGFQSDVGCNEGRIELSSTDQLDSFCDMTGLKTMTFQSFVVVSVYTHLEHEKYTHLYYYTTVAEQCEEECLNGGRCVGYNLCDCHANYDGYRCAYAIPEDRDRLSVTDVSPTIDPPFFERECSLFGLNHISTFDEKFYTFAGSCEYAFAVIGSVAVNVKIDAKCDGNVACLESFNVNVGGNRMTVSSQQEIKTDGIPREALPFFWHGFQVSNRRQFLWIECSEYIIKMDVKTKALSISMIKNNYDGSVQGLCGNANNIGLDDWKTRTGVVIHDVQVFIHDWATTNGCPQDSLSDEYSEYLDFDYLCDIMYTKEFGDCMDYLDFKPYYELCRRDMSRCDPTTTLDCHCSVLTQLSRDCARALHPVEDWRRETMCARNCPATQYFTERAPGCPHTCETVEEIDCGVRESDNCVCNKDLFWSDVDEICVSSDQCPCDHAAMKYLPNDKIELGCNNCICEAKSWTCTRNECPGVSMVYGSLHFKTYDGKWFDFKGTCTYTLVQYNEEIEFNIVVNTAECTKALSCLRSVKFISSSTSLELTTNIHSPAILYESGNSDGIPLTIPFFEDSIKIEYISSLYILVTIENLDVRILWFINGGLTVEVPLSYHGKLKGMAGTYTGLTTDDFLTYDNMTANTATDFGNKWAINNTGSCTPVDPIGHDDAEMLRDPSIDEKCKMLYSVFKDCLPYTESHTFYANCQVDLVACQNSLSCLCDSLAAYAQHCAGYGVTNTNWRSSFGCEINCPETQEYMEYGTRCGRTCRSISEPEACQKHHFAEGCNCPDGKFLNSDDKCVDISDCGCYKGTNWYHPREAFYPIPSTICECIHGRIECTRDDSTDDTICPIGMIYETCESADRHGTECIATCVTHISNTTCGATTCEPGCVCPEGSLRSNDGCIHPNECLCSYNGKYYHNEESFSDNCRTCTCELGKWNCIETPEDCLAECSVLGGIFFNSFDSKQFTSLSICEQILVKDGCGQTAHENLKIYMKNEYCMGGDDNICSIGITAEIDHITYHIENGEISIIDKSHEVVDPQHTISKKGRFQVISSHSGISLAFDESTTIYVYLTYEYKGKVCGICGNFDDDAHNDMNSPSQMLETQPSDFIDSWKTNKECQSVSQSYEKSYCNMHPTRKEFAFEQCSILKENPFKQCHLYVEYDKYYESCVEMTCSCHSGGDCECFCNAVAAYAHQCGQHGVIINWRSEALCPMMCESNNLDLYICLYQYDSCGSTDGRVCCDDNDASTYGVCYEGCFPNCPEGKQFERSSQMCVPINECDCPSSTTTTVTEFTSTSHITSPTSPEIQMNMTTTSPSASSAKISTTEEYTVTHPAETSVYLESVSTPLSTSKISSPSTGIVFTTGQTSISGVFSSTPLPGTGPSSEQETRPPAGISSTSLPGTGPTSEHETRPPGGVSSTPLPGTGPTSENETRPPGGVSSTAIPGTWPTSGNRTGPPGGVSSTPLPGTGPTIPGTWPTSGNRTGPPGGVSSTPLPGTGPTIPGTWPTSGNRTGPPGGVSSTPLPGTGPTIPETWPTSGNRTGLPGSVSSTPLPGTGPTIPGTWPTSGNRTGPPGGVSSTPLPGTGPTSEHETRPPSRVSSTSLPETAPTSQHETRPPGGVSSTSSPGTGPTSEHETRPPGGVSSTPLPGTGPTSEHETRPPGGVSSPPLPGTGSTSEHETRPPGEVSSTPLPGTRPTSQHETRPPGTGPTIPGTWPTSGNRTGPPGGVSSTPLPGTGPTIPGTWPTSGNRTGPPGGVSSTPLPGTGPTIPGTWPTSGNRTGPPGGVSSTPLPGTGPTIPGTWPTSGNRTGPPGGVSSTPLPGTGPTIPGTWPTSGNRTGPPGGVSSTPLPGTGPTIPETWPTSGNRTGLPGSVSSTPLPGTGPTIPGTWPTSGNRTGPPGGELGQLPNMRLDHQV
ncbi:mucin-6-like [Styela clava]